MDDGTLVTLPEAAREHSPAVPGLKFPTVLNELNLLNYGRTFGTTGGRLTDLPPVRGQQYEVRVPKPDHEGVDMGGIQRSTSPRRSAQTPRGISAEPPVRGTDLCGLNGSFVPFAETRAERMANDDPRLSLQERYTDHAGFVKAVEQAARTLVKERFLLEEDAQVMIRTAEDSDILQWST